MAERFEYKIFNMSEAEKINEANPNAKKVRWIDVLNSHGNDGWEIVFHLNKNSYLLKREARAYNSFEISAGR